MKIWNQLGFHTAVVNQPGFHTGHLMQLFWTAIFEILI